MRQILAIVLGAFFLLTSLPAQQRSVIVKNSDKELLRTAHRLGFAPERVAQAREFLREMSKLAPELAETEDIFQLGQFWVTLDRTAAAEQLTNLLRELSRRAGRTQQLEAYQKLLQNARSWADRLGTLQPEKAREIMDDWPEPPQISEEAQAENRLQDRRFEENRLRTRFLDDLEGGLQELRYMEGESGSPLLSARASAIGALLSQRRAEEANQLLDETLEMTPHLPPTIENLNAFRNLLFGYSRMGDRERTEELIGAWTVLAATAEIPGNPRLFQGIEFTAREYNVLSTLRMLSQTPELALQTLEHFPDLKRKLDPLGGISGYIRLSSQASVERGEESLDSMSGVQREVEERSQRFTRVAPGQEDEQAREIEDTLKLLPGLEPSQAATYFSNLTSYYFGLQGELTAEIRRLGLDIVRKLQEGIDSGEDPSEQGRFASRMPDRLLTNIHAMWLWSDPVEASISLQDLPERIRLQAYASYLLNLTQFRFRPWRMT